MNLAAEPGTIPFRHGSADMPETRNDGVVCFVHGHGAKYYSNRAPKVADNKEAQPVSPITLERIRQCAAAQLALQRVAIRTVSAK